MKLTDRAARRRAMTAVERQEVADDIIADAARMAPEHLAEIIRDADWYGSGAPTDTAVGNYLAMHLVIADVAAAVTVTVSGRCADAVDSYSGGHLAAMVITGGLAELQDAVAEGVSVFADLHDPVSVEAARVGAADLAEAFGSGPLAA